MSSAPQVVVGLDLGTGGAKAAACDPELRAWGSAAVEYPMASPQPGRAEQDPDEVADAALEALAATVEQARAAGARVAGVALSAAMHSLAAVDGAGRALTPLLTYADTRAAEQARRLRADPRGAGLHRRTGTPLHAMSPLAKLLWFREHDDVYARAARWVSAKEYLLLRLFGQAVVDHSIASATGLFNLRDRDWDRDALALVELDAGRLSEPVPTDHVLSGLDRSVADRLGLDPGTPFVVGAADGCLANLGAGAVRPGVAACTVGTSGAVRVASTSPRTDPGGRLFTYVLAADRWVIGGPISTGGLALRWLRDELLTDVAEQARAGGEDPYDRLTALAAASPPGAEGLLFLPHLAGERAPHWDADARGVLFGLTVRHRREHLVRAVLEGVAFQLRAVLETLADLGAQPDEIRATGGFTRSPLWLQVTADVFGRRLSVPRPRKSTRLGAALLGMVALGLVGSLDEAAAAVAVDETYQPEPQAARACGALFELFADLYVRLEGAYAQLAAVTAQ